MQLRQGRYDLDVLVDIKRIPQLGRINHDPVEGLTVGAAVTCAELVEAFSEAPKVRAFYAALADAASIIGGTAIRGRATLGGNLCNAAPSGDSIPAMIVLDGMAVVAGPEGERLVPVSAFCTGPGATVLKRGELVVALRLPVPKSHTGAAYVRFTPRGEMDIAVAGAGAWLALSEDGTRIRDARIALGAVAPTPLFVEAAGAALVGQPLNEESFGRAAVAAVEAATPITDTRGTAAQRRYLVGVLVKRALHKAAERATAGVPEEV